MSDWMLPHFGAHVSRRQIDKPRPDQLLARLVEVATICVMTKSSVVRQITTDQFRLRLDYVP
jgi:hypothetical protein